MRTHPHAMPADATNASTSISVAALSVVSQTDELSTYGDIPSAAPAAAPANNPALRAMNAANTATSATPNARFTACSAIPSSPSRTSIAMNRW